MKEKTKQILTIVGFILVVALAAILIWFLFFKTAGNPNTNNNSNTDNTQNNTPGKLTPSNGTTNNGKPVEVITNPDGTALTPDQIKDIINKNNGQDLNNVNNGSNTNTNTNIGGKVTDVSEKEGYIANGGIVYTNTVTNYPTLKSTISGNNLITFNSNDGGFYKVDPNTGISKLITEDKFKGAQNITWSPTSDKAVIEFPDGSNVTYDFTKNKQYILPKDWYSFSFQKDGDKIAFMVDSTNYKNRWLSISNPDGSAFSAIEALGNNADKVTVAYSPNEQMIALSRTGEPVGGLNQQVLLIGLNNENFKALEVEGRGFHPIWSPAGDKIVYDAFNVETSYNPNLWVVNASADKIGTSHKSLGIATWVSKCGFDSTGKYLYCGVPRPDGLPEGFGTFPTSLDEGDFYDDIYKINIYSGYSQLIAKPVPDVSVENLYVSSDDSLLYYKDKKTGYIYSMKLK